MDDEGVELGSGVMELTQCELVLRLQRREAVRWPYLCLRRYGYDSNLFSFESGRRCQTGQGESSQPSTGRLQGSCDQRVTRGRFCLGSTWHVADMPGGSEPGPFSPAAAALLLAELRRESVFSGCPPLP